jgi:hypothetical protein
VTDKALLEGAGEEQAEEEEWEGDREQELEEEGWVVPDQAPARRVSVCAPNAALLPPIKWAYPATRYSALSVVQQWSENRRLSNTTTTYDFQEES